MDLFNKNHKNKIDFFYLPIDPKVKNLFIFRIIVTQAMHF